VKILTRYILKEFVGNLLLGLLIFTFILLLDHLFELVDLLLSKGGSLWLTFELLFLLLPSSFSLTLPMSSLLAALLTFGRLSENNEITAVKASGLSPWAFMKPAILSGLALSLFLVPFNSQWAPHAHAQFRQIYVKVLESNPLVRIEEKVFFEIGEYHLFVEEKERKKADMTGITIYKTPAQGAPLRIFAERGKATVQPGVGVKLDLNEGRIEQIDPARPTQWFYTGFENYSLMIPLQTNAQASTRSLEEMDNKELQSQITDLKSKGLPYPLFACQMHMRWALAATPFLFVALGVPLAIRVQRGGRSIGFGISLVVIVAYYILLMGGTGLGQRGTWPPWLAVWLANAIVTGFSAALTWRFATR
jgi:lipopolysaccharide export system permease protein